MYLFTSDLSTCSIHFTFIRCFLCSRHCVAQQLSFLSARPQWAKHDPCSMGTVAWLPNPLDTEHWPSNSSLSCELLKLKTDFNAAFLVVFSGRIGRIHLLWLRKMEIPVYILCGFVFVFQKYILQDIHYLILASEKWFAAFNVRTEYIFTEVESPAITAMW